ncbi:acetyl-CoA synthetase-like protein [Daedaleopsis nitida]|nr:acetyl-CoA synthetase-like protein [Daedaleopsis nitida]
MAERSVDNHYLSLVVPSFRKHADALAFRPYIGRIDAWDSVTYQELEHRLAVTRAHWQRTLAPLNLKPLDVVGMWLTGRKWSDLLNNFAVASLGYTPQLFGSGDFTNISVIYELIAQSGGKVLIIDPSHMFMISSVEDIPVPHFSPLEDGQMLRVIDELKTAGRDDALTFGMESVAAVGRDELAVLFHSSGTTGGMPKIIPSTYKMVRVTILHKLLAEGFSALAHEDVKPVINTIGSTAHIASTHIFLSLLHVGGCMVQTSSTAIGADEFVGMRRVCGLSQLVIFATFLSHIIRAAQNDEKVKEALKEIYQISHTGVALNKDDEEWAHANDVKIVSSYSTTETGPLMRARRGGDFSSRLMHPIEGTNPVLLPYNTEEGGPQLFEVVIHADADDCPPPPLIAEDGYYHTKDIFEKIDDGYVYRGRTGDWIKTVDGFVDTKTIEDMVRKTCADVVYDAVVVGAGKPFPCLIIESAQSGLDENARKTVAQTIVSRIAEHSSRLFPHERIEDARRLLVVEKGTLIRTQLKGNVRRPATEALLATELQAIYDAA